MQKISGLKFQLKRANLIVGFVAHGILTVLAILVVVLMWYRASMGAQVDPESVTEARALAILRKLREELKDGAAERMQSYFPEGACFLNTLYGLAWANLASSPDLREEAIVEIRRALKGHESPAALEPFRWDTQVRRGAFWLGQRNLVLAKYLQLKPRDEHLTSLTEEFHENAHQYHSAIMEAPFHQIESYDYSCWPADAPMGLASLKIHDDMFATTYSEAINVWTDFHRAHGWKETALPPGKLEYRTGRHLEPARGCANSLIISVMAEVDPDYAAELYRDYQQHFQIARCGFAMFREYPADQTYQADVDSGPIIMGAGVTATGIGLAAARAVGDKEMEREIRDLSDMFGFPSKGTNPAGQPTIRYLGGLLPMGDAFLAWGYSMPRPEKAVLNFAKPPANRQVFHGIVIAALFGLAGQWVFFNWISRRRWLRLVR